MAATLTCCACGSLMNRALGSLPQGEAMCLSCRRKKPKSDRRRPCIECGSLAWKTRCRPCANARRRSIARDRKTPESFCVDCAVGLSGPKYTRCNSCNMVKRNRDRYGPDLNVVTNRRRRYTERRARDNAAPGPFKKKAREALLRRWKAQGRVCAYCLERPVATVDHVVPLSRGGTNFEGNLVPACSPCNTSKWDNLLSAWRYGIGARRSPVLWDKVA